MENKIPTAEKIFKEYCNLYSFEEGPSEYLLDKEDSIQVMIEFAKLHVEVALKEDSKKDTAGNEDCYYSSLIDKESILNAYPLDNIK